MEIAKARGFDPDMTLKNIILEEALYSSEQQEKIVENIGEYFLSENDNSSSNNRRVKLLVVDSPINHYRNEYVECKELPKRQKKLYRFMNSLLLSMCIGIASYNNSLTIKKTISNKRYNFDQLCLMASSDLII
jgi:hypothetical protein